MKSILGAQKGDSFSAWVKFYTDCLRVNQAIPAHVAGHSIWNSSGRFSQCCQRRADLLYGHQWPRRADQLSGRPGLWRHDDGFVPDVRQLSRSNRTRGQARYAYDCDGCS